MRLEICTIATMCLALSACQTPEAQPAAQGRTSSPESSIRVVGASSEVENCTYLADVKGDQNVYGGIFAGAAYNDAINPVLCSKRTKSGKARSLRFISRS